MTHEEKWGRFTLRGDEEVEACLTSLVRDVARAAEQTLTPSEYRALVLLGGYGRGEGGVETRDGMQRPHNNLDFMLITHNVPAWRQEEMRTTLRKRIDALVHAYGIDMDLSCDLHGAARAHAVPRHVVRHALRPQDRGRPIGLCPVAYPVSTGAHSPRGTSATCWSIEAYC